MRFILFLPFFLAIVLGIDEWTIRDLKRHMVYPLKDASDNLVYVTFSLDEQSALQLDFGDGRKPCVVPHKLAYHSRSQYRVAILGNGQVVVTMLNNEANRQDIKALLKLDWTLTIVDPKDCSYNHEVIGHFGKSFTGILPYMDSFNLEMKDNNENKVVRYKGNGKSMEFVARIPDDRYLGLRIAKEFDRTSDYYYVVPGKSNDLSTMKRLNSEFAVTQTYEIKHQGLGYDPQSYSVTFGRVTFCYFNGGRTSLECVVINEKLSGEISRVQLTYDHELSYTTVVNRREGEFVVVHVKSIDSDGKRMFTVYARRVDNNGKVGEVLTVGQVADEMYNMYAFEMHNGKLCIVVTSKEMVLTKCGSIGSKEIEL